jgi:D-alanyl-D-alanine carboxypeptidase (penicillin-binding protein 5/6)
VPVAENETARARPTPKRARSKRSYRRRRIAVGSVLLLVLAIGFYLPLTLLAPVSSVAAVGIPYSAPASTPPTLAMPGYGASAIGAIGFAGPLAQGGSSKPLPMASITKIITTLVVLEKKPLKPGQAGPGILFTSADEAIREAYAARDGDVYPIKVGGTMSESNVIKVALVASANNYARALADWAFGSEAKFLPVANAWVKAHGMTSTTLTDATGLNPANRSTPTDLITLGKLALADPIVSQTIAIKHVTLPVVGAIDNTNLLLGEYGVRGIKTGTLNDAGASLLFASDYTIGGRVITLVGVVLDGPDHPTIDGQIKKLITAVRSGFRNITLVHSGQSFGNYQTRWGTTSSVVATRGSSVVVWAGTKVASSVTIDPVALAKKGAIVGSARFTVDGKVYTVPLALTKAIADPGGWWRLTHPGELS